MLGNEIAKSYLFIKSYISQTDYKMLRTYRLLNTNILQRLVTNISLLLILSMHTELYGFISMYLGDIRMLYAIWNKI